VPDLEDLVKAEGTSDYYYTAIAVVSHYYRINFARHPKNLTEADAPFARLD
jgi:hypothetical protein